MKEIGGVTKYCLAFQKFGFPKQAKKLSLSHIDQKLNEEVQLDIIYLKINGKKNPYLHIVDCGLDIRRGL